MQQFKELMSYLRLQYEAKTLQRNEYGIYHDPIILSLMNDDSCVLYRNEILRHLNPCLFQGYQKRISKTRSSGRISMFKAVINSLCPRAESDLRVSLLDNGLVGPYSDTVLVTSFSPGSSTCASRVRWLNSASFVNSRWLP
ncbi:hypothetical protein TNCV_2225621 [Trichonephila clavipes]|nr:hypothetical protein TNCV_2225621 [Trichonephila clavipes]